MAILSHKSFPTWGRNQAFSSPLNGSLPHKSFPTWGRIWTFFPKHMAFLNHMGQDSSQAFFPWSAQLSFPTWGRSHAFFLEVHPSLASPQNAMLPSPPILSHLFRQGFFSLQNVKPTQNASLQILTFHGIFIFLFFSFHFFHYYFLWFFFSVFSKKPGILPQSGKIIPQHLRQIIE